MFGENTNRFGRRDTSSKSCVQVFCKKVQKYSAQSVVDQSHANDCLPQSGDTAQASMEELFTQKFNHRFFLFKDLFYMIKNM